MNKNLLKILFGEEVTYHLLDDPGLVHYTEGLLQIFAKKEFETKIEQIGSKLQDYDDLKRRVEALETQLEGVEALLQENI